MTVAAALQQATQMLAAGGIAHPRLNAELIVGHALGYRRLELTLNHDQAVGGEAWQVIEQLVADRCTQRPLQYVLGETEFLGLKLKVDERALVPRPETELLVEQVLERVRDIDRPRLADVGTGCGAIGLSLAHFRPDARVLLTDRSAQAVDLAFENAQRLGLRRVELGAGDLFAPLLATGGQFDAVCCNLPYVPRETIEQLQAEVREHEPRLALDGGCDGLDLYRRAAREALPVLGPGSLLACEMGVGQSAQMRGLFASVPEWRQVEVIKDYAGVERVLIATT